MLNQNSLDDLINHLQLNTVGWMKTGDGYYEVMCPECDTSNQTKRYHGRIQLKELNFTCWRGCKSRSILSFLLNTGYNNQSVIDELKTLTKRSNRCFVFNNNNNKYYTRSNFDKDLRKSLKGKHLDFKKEYSDKYNQYLEYINYRCGNINPIKYGFSPLIKNGKLAVEFYNSSGHPVTLRFVDQDSNMRYLKYKNGGYYYFQKIEKVIDDYSSITICEGIFDAINLSKYYLNFSGSFFFAINNREYISILKYLITKYFLLGTYNFNIVFDKDINDNKNKLKYQLNEIKQKYNPECKINFYMPSYTKDVSELMIMEKT